jgi:uncharacterized membrane protein HdeD (DUF308 family)
MGSGSWKGERILFLLKTMPIYGIITETGRMTERKKNGQRQNARNPGLPAHTALEEGIDMLFEELGKIKRSTIMTSIIMVAVGIVMIMCPPEYVNSLVAVLGVGMIVFATVWILDFISGTKSLINYIKLTGALIVLLIGLAVLIFENIVLIIGIVFGLALIIAGGIGIFNACTYARRADREFWWLLVVLSGILVILGLMILINPWWSEPVRLFDVIGVALLFSSVVSIVRLYITWPIKLEKEG